MQISRHWRMQKQRYRLVGVRYPDGEVALQPKVPPVEVNSVLPQAILRELTSEPVTISKERELV